MDCAGCPNREPWLLPRLHPAARLWLHVQTQWRAGMAVTGLDYNAVAHVARWLGLELDPELLDCLMRLEAWSLDKINAERDNVATANKNRRQRPG